MPDYCAFELDQTGHIVGRIDPSSMDDEDAKKQAAQLMDGHDVELWQGDRKIAVFKSPEIKS